MKVKRNFAHIFCTRGPPQRLDYSEVMAKSLVSCFFWLTVYSYVTCYFEFNKADTAHVTVSKQTLKLVTRNSLCLMKLTYFLFGHLLALGWYAHARAWCQWLQMTLFWYFCYSSNLCASVSNNDIIGSSCTYVVCLMHYHVICLACRYHWC